MRRLGIDWKRVVGSTAFPWPISDPFEIKENQFVILKLMADDTFDIDIVAPNQIKKQLKTFKASAGIFDPRKRDRKAHRDLCTETLMTCLAEMETFVEARETTGLAQAKTSQAKGAKMIRWTDDAPTEIRAEEGWNPRAGRRRISPGGAG